MVGLCAVLSLSLVLVSWSRGSVRAALSRRRGWLAYGVYFYVGRWPGTRVCAPQTAPKTYVRCAKYPRATVTARAPAARCDVNRWRATANRREDVASMASPWPTRGSLRAVELTRGRGDGAVDVGATIVGEPWLRRIHVI